MSILLKTMSRIPLTRTGNKGLWTMRKKKTPILLEMDFSQGCMVGLVNHFESTWTTCAPPPLPLSSRTQISYRESIYRRHMDSHGFTLFVRRTSPTPTRENGHCVHCNTTGNSQGTIESQQPVKIDAVPNLGLLPMNELRLVEALDNA